MKQIVSNYTYSPTANAVTLTGLNIDADQLLLIVAPEVGRTLYNFATVTGSVVAGSDTRVNLNASTVGLTTTSPLVIFYDDQASAQSVTFGQTTVTGQVELGPTSLNALESITVTMGQVTVTGGLTDTQLRASAVTVGGTVTANLSTTDYSEIENIRTETQQINTKLTNPLPISGTVTANVDFAGEPLSASPSKAALIGWDDNGTFQPVRPNSGLPVYLSDFAAESFPISGTVTVGNTVTANINGTVPISISSVTIGAMPNGSLTTRFGSVTTANTAQITSAVTNSTRKYLLAQNISAGTVTIGIGFSPTTTQGIQLTAGAGITFESSYIPTGAVYVLSSVTASNFTILEA